MNLKIGNIIKNLRITHKITQDQLATFLGVTPQAISRWESGGSYPDIELLPAIAEFFSVSTDDLLGINRTQREQRLAEVYDKITMYNELNGSLPALGDARAFVAEFPSDEKVQLFLAATLCRTYMFHEPEEHLTELTEAEKIFVTLTETTKDQEFRHEVISWLATLYRVGFKDTLRAEKVMATLPKMRFCREATRSGVLDGDAKPTQEYIECLTANLCRELLDYIAYVIPNDPEGWDMKLSYYEKVIDLYHTIFGEELLYYHGELAAIYRYMATYLVAQGKVEETLDALDKMCDHAIAADSAQVGDAFTSPFVNCLKYEEEHRLKHVNAAYFCWRRMLQARYDPIREEPRFVAMVARLHDTAKCIIPVKDRPPKPE